MQPPGNGGKKIYRFGLGHMTKMAAMPIYGKNLKKIIASRHIGMTEKSKVFFLICTSSAHEIIFKEGRKK